MDKVIIAPDSFKGTMSAVEVCEILRGVFAQFMPECLVISLPIADGGEGTVDAFLAATDGRRVTLRVKGPLGEDAIASYAHLCDGTCVIEMAQAAGLPMVGDRKNPLITTTFGVGQLINHAVENGATRVLLGLGGSATHDGGCGAVCALGGRFFDKNGEMFVPTGGTLKDIARVECDKLRVPLTLLCDIDNPPCGSFGAAAVFGPQKGADDKQVRLLDDGLSHLVEILNGPMDIPGGGAAGGMGVGLHAMLGGQIKPGITEILRALRFDEHIEHASMVITGEGRIDGQSLRGKAVLGVAKAARGVPVIAIVGDIGEGIDALYQRGVTCVFSINRVAQPYEAVKHRAKRDLRDTMESILRLLKGVSL